MQTVTIASCGYIGYRLPTAAEMATRQENNAALFYMNTKPTTKSWQLSEDDSHVEFTDAQQYEKIYRAAMTESKRLASRGEEDEIYVMDTTPIVLGDDALTHTQGCDKAPQGRKQRRAEHRDVPGYRGFAPVCRPS